jgi:hypothetical protein
VRVGWPAPEKKVGGGIYREARSDGRPIAAAARAGWGAEATREWVRAREAGGRRLRPEVAAGAFDGAARAADGNRGRRGWMLKTIHVRGGPAQMGFSSDVVSPHERKPNQGPNLHRHE